MENQIRKQLHLKSFKYSSEKYNFREILSKLFGCAPESLHLFLGNFNKFNRSNDQNTLAHRVFYSNFKEKLEPLYQKFQRDVIVKIIKVPFYYQVIPTFRIGLPGNKFVGEYHKDSDYNHKPYEVNFNLGICNYLGDSALKTETFKNSGKFFTKECPYGEIFSFDHIDCLHGSDPNKTALTMVSFDFRIAIKSLFYEDDSASSINMRTKFSPGFYFSKNELSI